MNEKMAGLPSAVVHAIPLRFTTVDFPRLVRSTLEPLNREAMARDVTLAVDSPEDISVVADPEKIAWAVATLVGNALRYVRHGTHRLPGGSILVRIRRGPRNEGVVIDVADDGPGIPKDALATLFERRPGEAHAVGLALKLVLDIVTAHGGSVTVESSTEPDAHGTTVRVTLP